MTTTLIHPDPQIGRILIGYVRLDADGRRELEALVDALLAEQRAWNPEQPVMADDWEMERSN